MATKAYFDNIKEHIIEQLNTSTKSIKVAVAWFTDAELFELLCKKAKKGLRVEVLIANNSINHNSSIDYEKLNNAGGKLYFIGEGTDNEPIMHHKFCIIDNETLMFGSYNWTNKAKSNHENITVISGDAKIILDYNDEFEKLRYFENNAKSSNSSVKVKILKLKLENILPFNDGLARIKRKGKWGFIDKNGNEIISCIYDKLDDFSNRYAKYKLNSKSGYVDKDNYITDKPVEIPIPFHAIFDNGGHSLEENESYPIAGFNLYNEEGKNILKYTAKRWLDENDLQIFDNYFIFDRRLFSKDGEKLVKKWRKLVYENEAIELEKFDKDDDDYHSLEQDESFNRIGRGEKEESYYLEQIKYVGNGYFFIFATSNNGFNRYVKSTNEKKLCEGFRDCGEFCEGYIFIQDDTSKKSGYFTSLNGTKFRVDYDSRNMPKFSSGLAVAYLPRPNKVMNYSQLRKLDTIKIYDTQGNVVVVSSRLLDEDVTSIDLISDFYDNIAFLHSNYVYVIKYDDKTKNFDYVCKNEEKVRFNKNTLHREKTEKKDGYYKSYEFIDGLALVRFENCEYDSIIDSNLNEVFKIEYLREY